jgi:hypothetical protein
MAGPVATVSAAQGAVLRAPRPGQEVVAPDLPTEDDAAGLPEYAEAVVEAVGDRFFPPEFLRRVVRERLGIVPDEIDGSHCVALSRPRELADRLEGYRAAL